ncbi:ComF family protein [bacterium SCSIO 12643]|nr:ComF family protein [bacterium SCSIO 12643]
MGELLGAQILDSNRFKEIDLIIPVPLHPQKFKKRGYNQSEKLAQGVAKVLNLPLDISTLTRSTDNSTQTKKGLFNRWTNVQHVFSIMHPERLQGKHILLVDDVITSGATIEACAKQILQIQGSSISIISLAFAND